MGVLSINSNLSAQAATRRLGQVDARLGTSLERLSTGMRINRASDDPAGLAVSSTLETRGRLYGQADRNIRDGLSALDILDGALDGQSNILIRLSELAEQSANGSLSSKQRQALQVEYSQLQKEFNRIAETTVFNGQKLAFANHGGTSNLVLQTGISGSSTSTLGTRLSDTGAASGTLGLNQLVAETVGNINDFTDFGQSAPTRAQILDRYGVVYRVDIDTGGGQSQEIFLVLFADPGNTDVVVRGLVQRPNSDAYDIAQFSDDKVSSDAIGFDYDSTTGTLARPGNDWSFDVEGVGNFTLDFNALRATNSANSAIDFSGIESVTRSRAALDATQARLAEFSTLRGQLGAAASRLNANLALTAANKENTAAALSRLRDVDVAAETSQMTTQQILRQAATAVLAQANQQPALALQLLK